MELYMVSMLQVELEKCFQFGFILMFGKMYTGKILLNGLYTKYLKKYLHVNCLKKCMRDGNQAHARVVRINLARECDKVVS